jgi:large subunit ribosomal protein L20
MLHALSYQYAHRKERKGDMRRLWITRINAAARVSGLSYSQLIHGLQLAGIAVDRKILAELAYSNPAEFAQVADKARESLGAASAA